MKRISNPGEFASPERRAAFAQKSRPKKKNTSQANVLTIDVLKACKSIGAFASRIQSQGQWNQGLGKFTKSHTAKGFPDVVAVYRSRFIGLEIKAGSDRMSPDQLEVATQIKAAGGLYFIIRSQLDIEALLEYLQKGIQA